MATESAEDLPQTPETEAATVIVKDQAQEILKPTLYDNDFLQSFVRVGLESNAETKHGRRKSPAPFCAPIRKEVHLAPEPRKDATSDVETESTSENVKSAIKKSKKSRNRKIKESLNNEIQKSKRKKKRKGGSRREEEIYTDKDRAAAVNLGSRDIKQSLKLKRRQDRSNFLQIPEEAEPGAILALAAREMRFGNFKIAIDCINKALELSPGDRNALIARSKCYLLLGEPQKALQDAEAALQEKLKDPNNARAMYCKAEALYHLGDFELSLVYYYRGMRIRPEFDQFRLGVQKAKEAIQNILGDNITPNAILVPDKAKSVSNEATQVIEPRVLDSDSKIFSLQGQKIYPTTQQNKELNVEHNDNVQGKSERSRSRQSVSSHGKNGGQHFLGQLKTDKAYLQNLLRSPDIKTAQQLSTQQNITTYVEEGIAFLEMRQEFWRQQLAKSTTRHRSSQRKKLPLKMD